mmetsp:Transcript_33823/g.100386  ORF Transcript_33823/g.100386 Transcript_33823/m.100386 type:complete len:628 (-) Transcript_33823:46-1929(-)
MADRRTSPALSQISPHARTECFAADCLERRGPASAEHLPETTSETRPEVEGGACANPPPPAASAGEGASREECGAPGAPAGSGGGGGILENQGVDDRLDDVDGELAAGADARVLRGECVGFGARRGRLEGAVPRERLVQLFAGRVEGLRLKERCRVSIGHRQGVLVERSLGEGRLLVSAARVWAADAVVEQDRLLGDEGGGGGGDGRVEAADLADEVVPRGGVAVLPHREAVVAGRESDQPVPNLARLALKELARRLDAGRGAADAGKAKDEEDLVHELDAVLAAVLHGQLAVHFLEGRAQPVLVDEVRRVLSEPLDSADQEVEEEALQQPRQHPVGGIPAPVDHLRDLVWAQPDRLVLCVVPVGRLRAVEASGADGASLRVRVEDDVHDALHDEAVEVLLVIELGAVRHDPILLEVRPDVLQPLVVAGVARKEDLVELLPHPPPLVLLLRGRARLGLRALARVWQEDEDPLGEEVGNGGGDAAEGRLARLTALLDRVDHGVGPRPDALAVVPVLPLPEGRPLPPEQTQPRPAARAGEDEGEQAGQHVTPPRPREKERPPAPDRLGRPPRIVAVDDRQQSAEDRLQDVERQQQPHADHGGPGRVRRHLQSAHAARQRAGDASGAQER